MHVIRCDRVKIFVEFSLKQLCCRDPVLPSLKAIHTIFLQKVHMRINSIYHMATPRVLHRHDICIKCANNGMFMYHGTCLHPNLFCSFYAIPILHFKIQLTILSLNSFFQEFRVVWSIFYLPHQCYCHE